MDFSLQILNHSLEYFDISKKKKNQIKILSYGNKIISETPRSIAMVWYIYLHGNQQFQLFYENEK